MTKNNEEKGIAIIERIVAGQPAKAAIAAEGVSETMWHSWIALHPPLIEGVMWAHELDILVDQIDRKLKGADLAKAGVKPGSADLKRVRQIIAGRIIRHGEAA